MDLIYGLFYWFLCWKLWKFSQWSLFIDVLLIRLILLFLKIFFIWQRSWWIVFTTIFQRRNHWNKTSKWRSTGFARLIWFIFNTFLLNNTQIVILPVMKCRSSSGSFVIFENVIIHDIHQWKIILFLFLAIFTTLKTAINLLLLFVTTFSKSSLCWLTTTGWLQDCWRLLLCLSFLYKSCCYTAILYLSFLLMTFFLQLLLYRLL